MDFVMYPVSGEENGTMISNNMGWKAGKKKSPKYKSDKESLLVLKKKKQLRLTNTV